MTDAALRLGPDAVAAVAQLRPLLEQLSDTDDLSRLTAVNRFINGRVKFGEDAEVWGAADYWASPLETLARGAGDCEDFAIAKYFSLLAAGVPPARLRLVYVRAQLDPGARPVPHMVLAYHPAPADTPLILDNLVPDVLSAARRPDLNPVFSFNSEGLWQGVDGSPAGDPLARLSRWREVLAKAHGEGFL